MGASAFCAVTMCSSVAGGMSKFSLRSFSTKLIVKSPLFIFWDIICPKVVSSGSPILVNTFFVILRLSLEHEFHHLLEFLDSGFGCFNVVFDLTDSPVSLKNFDFYIFELSVVLLSEFLIYL